MEFVDAPPSTVAIIGVGLIGGSLALALRRAWPSVCIVGKDVDAENLASAIREKVIDRNAEDRDIANADIIVLAAPVGQTAAMLADIAPNLSANTVVTDVGSTKQDVLLAAQQVLGSAVSRFVPGHPIAGREMSGVAAADATLFIGKNAVLTPHELQDAAALARVTRMWKATGANVLEMAPSAHDAVFAAVSHLPHMLAFALVDSFARRADAKQLFSFAASGFRDFTRIASSSPEMWRDIALNNREAIVTELDRFLAEVASLRDVIAEGDAAALTERMTSAHNAREQWLVGDLSRFRDEAA